MQGSGLPSLFPTFSRAPPPLPLTLGFWHFSVCWVAGEAAPRALLCSGAALLLGATSQDARGQAFLRQQEASLLDLTHLTTFPGTARFLRSWLFPVLLVLSQLGCFCDRPSIALFPHLLTGRRAAADAGV